MNIELSLEGIKNLVIIYFVAPLLVDLLAYQIFRLELEENEKVIYDIIVNKNRKKELVTYFLFLIIISIVSFLLIYIEGILQIAWYTIPTIIYFVLIITIILRRIMIRFYIKNRKYKILRTVIDRVMQYHITDSEEKAIYIYVKHVMNSTNWNDIRTILDIIFEKSKLYCIRYSNRSNQGINIVLGITSNMALIDFYNVISYFLCKILLVRDEKQYLCILRYFLDVHKKIIYKYLIESKEKINIGRIIELLLLNLVKLLDLKEKEKRKNIKRMIDEIILDLRFIIINIQKHKNIVIYYDIPTLRGTYGVELSIAGEAISLKTPILNQIVKSDEEDEYVVKYIRLLGQKIQEIANNYDIRVNKYT